MGNLENVSAETLRETLERVEGADPAKRLMVAIAYKEIDGLSQNGAAELYGFSSGWASRWFRRLERLETEPFEDVLYDEPRPGRPSKLADEQRAQLDAVLNGPPADVGFDAPEWTVALARRYLEGTFDVEYSARHVRRLMREAGLTWETSEPAFDGSDGRAGEAVVDAVAESRTVWTTNSRSSTARER